MLAGRALAAVVLALLAEPPAAISLRWPDPRGASAGFESRYTNFPASSVHHVTLDGVMLEVHDETDKKPTAPPEEEDGKVDHIEEEVKKKRPWAYRHLKEKLEAEEAEDGGRDGRGQGSKDHHKSHEGSGASRPNESVVEFPASFSCDSALDVQQGLNYSNNTRTPIGFFFHLNVDGVEYDADYHVTVHEGDASPSAPAVAVMSHFGLDAPRGLLSATAQVSAANREKMAAYLSQPQRRPIQVTFTFDILEYDETKGGYRFQMGTGGRLAGVIDKVGEFALSGDQEFDIAMMPTSKKQHISRDEEHGKRHLQIAWGPS